MKNNRRKEIQTWTAVLVDFGQIPFLQVEDIYYDVAC